MDADLREEIVNYIITHQELFYKLAYSYVRTKEPALDIVQNAIVKALEHYTSIKNIKYVKTWFYRVLVNECLTYIKKSKREFLFEPEKIQKIQEAPVEQEEETEIFEEVLKLPEEMKTILILRFYEDFTLSEIADVTGLKLSTVKYRLYAGLNKIRENLKEESL